MDGWTPRRPRATWYVRSRSESGDANTVAIEPVLATGSLDILIAAARQGTGIALAPAVNFLRALASGALVQVLPDWTAVEGILHLVFASRRGMLPRVRAVIGFIAAALKSSAVRVGTVLCGVHRLERAVRDLLTNRAGALAP